MIVPITAPTLSPMPEYINGRRLVKHNFNRCQPFYELKDRWVFCRLPMPLRDPVVPMDTRETGAVSRIQVAMSRDNSCYRTTWTLLGQEYHKKRWRLIFRCYDRSNGSRGFVALDKQDFVMAHLAFGEFTLAISYHWSQWASLFIGEAYMGSLRQEYLEYGSYPLTHDRAAFAALRAAKAAGTYQDPFSTPVVLGVCDAPVPRTDPGMSGRVEEIRARLAEIKDEIKTLIDSAEIRVDGYQRQTEDFSFTLTGQDAIDYDNDDWHGSPWDQDVEYGDTDNSDGYELTDSDWETDPRDEITELEEERDELNSELRDLGEEPDDE